MLVLLLACVPDPAADQAGPENTAPTARIEAPDRDGRYYTGEPVTFRGVVGDAEDAPDALTVAWSSDIAGAIALAATPGADGVVEGEAILPAGTHVLTLTVTDTDGGSTAATSAVTIGAVNAAPTCAITAPGEGDAFPTGASIALAGVVGDVDEGPLGLVVTWSSDVDGEIGPATPGADGAVTADAAGLSPGRHVVTLAATDERGLSCADTVELVVGSAPEVAIVAPVDGDLVNEGDTVSFVADVLDDLDVPGDLAVSWTSDRDGTLSVAAADELGVVRFDTAALSAGTHVVTLTVTDTHALVASASVVLRVNGLPTAPTVGITPGAPVAGDDLVAAVITPATDLEGDTVTYAWSWTVDGAPAADAVGETVPGAALRRGQVWTASAVASDGLGTGPAGSASVVVGNTAPVVTAVSLSPAAPSTLETLTASVVSADVDGDAVSLTYTWSVNGVVVTTETTGTLDGTLWFDRDDEVSVEVTPDDGTDAGAPLASAAVTVGNSPPSAPTVSIDDSTGDLVCTVVTASADGDGDTLSYSVAWDLDGVTYPGAVTTTWDGDTLPEADRAAGIWTCTMTPDDGADTGAAGSASYEQPEEGKCARLTVAVIRGWATTYTSASLGWNDVLADQASFGDCDLTLVDVARGFDEAALVATGAEVLFVSSPSGASVDYTAAEVAAIEGFLANGYGVVGSYLFYGGGDDNRDVLELMGVDSAGIDSGSTSIGRTTRLVDTAHPLSTGFAASFTSLYWPYEQSTTGSWSDALLSGAEIVMSNSSGQNVVIAYEPGGWRGVYLTGMVDYNTPNDDAERLLYNAVIWAAGYEP